MVAVLALNPRKGNLAESLGTVLLQGTAAVAPVARTEDIGVDVVATLLRQDGSYRVVAENSFYVQFKAASIRSLEFNTAEQVGWLLSLELPFFIGSVDVAKAQIDLFACHRLTQAVIEGMSHKTIILSLDDKNEFDGPTDGRKLYIGPPVHSWTASEIAGPTFVESVYGVLKPHVEAGRRNIELRRSGRFEQLAWETGKVPELASVSMFGGGLHGKSLKLVMDLAMPYLSACLLEAKGGGHSALFEKTLSLIRELSSLGAKPDPIVDSIVR